MSTPRLSAALEGLPSGVLVEDEHRRLVLINGAACTMFGIPVPPAQLVGADCAEMAAQAAPAFRDPQSFLGRIEDLLAGREAVHGELLELRDGRVLSRDYLPLFLEEGYAGHMWQYRDVTSQRAAEQELLASERRKSAIFQTALDAIVTIDEEGNVLEWNRAAERLFGWTPEEAMGREMGKLIVPEEFRAAHRAGMKRYLATNDPHVIGKRVELHGMHRDGHTFPCELAVAELQTGEGQRVFTGFLRDISDRHLAEEALRQARDAAEQASQAKTEFLATMSHEIRTPLNAVLGMAELLETTSLDGEQQEFLRTMRGAGEVLLALLNDFLDLSKIEAGQLDLAREAFDPADVARQVVAIMQTRAQSKGVELSVEARSDGLATVGDVARVRQVLLNLVGNAVKFTDRGRVRVTLDIQDVGEAVRLAYAVCDTGIGIPQGQQERVFGHFQQVDATRSRRFGGTGLGLAICRGLAEQMGGRVWLERSSPGEGSEFRFEVDLERAQGVPPDDEPTVVPQGRSCSPLEVLVVDDSPANIELTRRWLEAAGHSADAAEDGPQALDALARRTYDLVLMDIEMPGMDGLEVVQRLREQEQALGGSPVPVVALTAHVLNDSRQRCLDAGMQDFLAKPVSRNTLLSGVEKWADGRPRVLFVDDAYEMRVLATKYLEHDGRFRPVVASSGAQALELLARQQVALVVLDVEMPLMDGFELTRQIRERHGDHPAIVALTGHRDPRMEHRAREAGANAWLGKPIRREGFVQAVSQWASGGQRGVATDGPVALVDPDIADLIPEYLQNRADDLIALDEALADLDFEVIRRLGHNLKGTSAGYGFADLGELGARLERAGMQADGAHARETIEAIRTYLDRVEIRYESAD